MNNIFKNIDLDAIRIKKSQEKIAQHPEKKFPKLLLAKYPVSLFEQETEILTEEEELLKQLEEIRNKKKEIELEKKKIEEEKRKRMPEVFSFRRFGNGQVTFDLENGNPIALEILESHKGYIYSSEGYNPINQSKSATIDFDNFKSFHKEVNEVVPNCKWINFEPLFQPYWKIKKLDKNIAVQWNPITNKGGWYKGFKSDDGNLRNIPGTLLYQKYYAVPLSEGWRLYQIHPVASDDFVEWDLDLLLEVKKEFDKRVRVRTIHTAEDSEVDYKKLAFPLRAHQRVALEFSDLVDNKTIIAYGTGTGKTAIAIADALRTKAERILVIVPGSLRTNMARHIKMHTGEDPVVLAGRAPIKHDYKHLLYEHPKWVIINYEILRTAVKIKNEKDDIFTDDYQYPWVDLLQLYHPDYIIIDESHYIRNPSAHQSKAVRQLGNISTKKMALSGTPIWNRAGELWSVLNWLHPEQFPYYETFLNQYGFGRSIGQIEATKLRSLLETIMLKRTRQDISKNLPPVNRIVETFDMSPRARKIYDKILDGIYEELATYDPQGVGGQQRTFRSILPKINAMIKVCAADKVDNTVERAIAVVDANEELEWNKVLIFTHFKGTCNTIARKLGHEALSFVTRGDGGFTTLDMPERMKLVDQFQSDPNIKFLVATEGSAREGLDITKAGVVMFNDLFWTPGAHLQCEGRAFYRESDMHGGDSMYLTFNDSIEEWIVELQGIKQDTIDKVIEGKGIESSITSEIVSRIQRLFQDRMKGK